MKINVPCVHPNLSISVFFIWVRPLLYYIIRVSICLLIQSLYPSYRLAVRVHYFSFPAFTDYKCQEILSVDLRSFLSEPSEPRHLPPQICLIKIVPILFVPLPSLNLETKIETH